MCPFKLHIHDEKHQQNDDDDTMQCDGDLWKKQNCRKSLFVRSAEANNKIAEDCKLYHVKNLKTNLKKNIVTFLKLYNKIEYKFRPY